MSRAHIHTKQATYDFSNPSTWVSVDVSTRISTRMDTPNLLTTIFGRRLVEPTDQIDSTSYVMTGCLIPKHNKEQTTCLKSVLDPRTRHICRILRVPPRSSRATPASFGCLGALPYLSRLWPAQASCILHQRMTLCPDGLHL
jgi:hypothetical protein